MESSASVMVPSTLNFFWLHDATVRAMSATAPQFPIFLMFIVVFFFFIYLLQKYTKKPKVQNFPLPNTQFFPKKINYGRVYSFLYIIMCTFAAAIKIAVLYIFRCFFIQDECNYKDHSIARWKNHHN